MRRPGSALSVSLKAPLRETCKTRRSTRYTPGTLVSTLLPRHPHSRLSMEMPGALDFIPGGQRNLRLILRVDRSNLFRFDFAASGTVVDGRDDFLVYEF